MIWINMLLILINPLDGMFVDYDTILLSKIITAECSICPLDEQYLVGSTVLNRVENSCYPDDIKSVIYQDNQYHGVTTKWFIKTPKTLQVAKDLMEGKRRDKDVIFFYRRDSPNKAFVKKISKYVKYKKKFHNFAIQPKNC